jgi:PAS domain S-box-containing protein
MARLNPNPSQLWEQWLQRLHGIVDPTKDYFRLELVQLLSKTETGDKKRFLSRFGTILCHSLQGGKVYIIDKSDWSPIYWSNGLDDTMAVKLKPLLPPKDNGFLTRQFPRGRKISSHLPAVKIIVQLPLAIFTEEEIFLLVIYENSQAPEDRQFIQFVAGLLAIHTEKAGLSYELNQEKKLLELLTQHINEGLLLAGSDTKVKIWNRPLQRITGYSLKEAREKTVDEVLRVADKPKWFGDLLELHRRSGQNGFVNEWPIETKTKQTRWIAVSGSFLRDDNGDIHQVIAIVRDISKEKQLEQRKNEFISIATHELRTPITAIKGYLSLLQANTDSLSEKQKQYLNNAYNATERLVGLAEDLLQVIRIDEDRMKFSLQPVDLTKVVEKVAADFSDKIRRKGLVFRLTLPPFSTRVIADPIRLEQVFANLIDNAIKYTTEGFISVAFEHYSDRLTQEDKVTVVIKDTGIGIDSKDVEGIFQKFHRSDKAANLREPGAGLGLYIVKSFIEKQNGQISVKSRPKRGSTFAVTFSTVPDTPVKTVTGELDSENKASNNVAGKAKSRTVSPTRYLGG